MSELTEAQLIWLKTHPEYSFIGIPRPGVRFSEVGTLYPDGLYEKNEPMKPVRLVSGPPYAVGVGVRL